MVASKILVFCFQQFVTWCVFFVFILLGICWIWGSMHWFFKIKFEKNLATISSNIFSPLYLSGIQLTHMSHSLMLSYRSQVLFLFYSIFSSLWFGLEYSYWSAFKFTGSFFCSVQKPSQYIFISVVILWCSVLEIPLQFWSSHLYPKISHPFIHYSYPYLQILLHICIIFHIVCLLISITGHLGSIDFDCIFSWHGSNFSASSHVLYF